MENDDNPDIGDIDAISDTELNEVSEPERWVEQSNVEREALILNPEMDKHLEWVSASAAWRYGQDKSDVKQEIYLKMWTERDPIRYPKAWSYRTAQNLGLNEVRHQTVERSYAERKTLEAKESASYKGEPLVQCSAVLTPEQELLQNERYLLVERTVLDAVRQSPSWLANAWDPEKSPKEIIAETGRPAATVYRRLEEMQKRIVSALREIGIEPYEQ